MESPTLIVNVTITKSTRTVSGLAFNVPVILGPSNRFSDAYRSYVSPQDMISDGFELSDPEYIEALALMSQAGPKPPRFLVSKFSAAVAQVDTFQVGTLTTGHQYKFTMDSVVISYTSSGGDTQQSVLAALLAAIGTAFPSNPPVTGAVTGSGAGATLTLTSSVAGQGVSYTAIDSDLTKVNVTPNHSIVNDIQILQDAVAPADQFYGVLVTSHVATDILQVATYIESQLLVYVTATADAGCLTSGNTDIMSQLKALSLDRTMILYSAQANTNGPDGAWMGYMLPTTPGVGNWAMKTLAGVDADNLTASQIANVVSKNGNVYVIVGGNGTTLYGISTGGEYFDVAIFLDWLASTSQTNLIAVETDPLNLKVPYTNRGIAMLANALRATLQQGQDNQGLAAGWSVFAPNVNDVPQADKLSRTLNNFGFNATLAGAINKINIQGYVSS